MYEERAEEPTDKDISKQEKVKAYALKKLASAKAHSDRFVVNLTITIVTLDRSTPAAYTKNALRRHVFAKCVSCFPLLLDFLSCVVLSVALPYAAKPRISAANTELLKNAEIWGRCDHCHMVAHP